MKRQIIHKAIRRRGPFGGTVTTTLCGRSRLTDDGMNSDSRNITCKFCLKKLAEKGE